MELPAPERRYGEKEIGRILKRASELQRAEPTAPDPAGMTLAELEDIAREAGIDDAHVRRAAAELASPASGIVERLVGGPVRLRLERAIPGELPVEAFDEVIPLIQMAADSPGQASRVGRTLTWNSQTQGNTRSLQVMMVVRDGETLVRIDERLEGLAWGLHGGVVGGAGVGGGIGFGVPLGVAIGVAGAPILLPATVIVAAYAGARRIFHRMARRRRGALQALLERLSEVVRERSAGRLEGDGPDPLPPGGD